MRRGIELDAAYQARSAKVVAFATFASAPLPLLQTADGGFVGVFPFDAVSWTKGTAKVFTAMTAEAKQANASGAKQLSIAGTTTKLAKGEADGARLGRRGQRAVLNSAVYASLEVRDQHIAEEIGLAAELAAEAPTSVVRSAKLVTSITVKSTAKSSSSGVRPFTASSTNPRKSSAPFASSAWNSSVSFRSIEATLSARRKSTSAASTIKNSWMKALSLVAGLESRWARMGDNFASSLSQSA